MYPTAEDGLRVWFKKPKWVSVFWRDERKTSQASWAIEAWIRSCRKEITKPWGCGRLGTPSGRAQKGNFLAAVHGSTGDKHCENYRCARTAFDEADKRNKDANATQKSRNELLAFGARLGIGWSEGTANAVTRMDYGVYAIGTGVGSCDKTSREMVEAIKAGGGCRYGGIERRLQWLQDDGVYHFRTGSALIEEGSTEFRRREIADLTLMLSSVKWERVAA